MTEKTSVPFRRKIRGLNRTVLVLGFVSLLGDISSEMLYPVTPIFLTSLLGASASVVGLIEGTAEAIASLLKIYAGHLSDRWRTRKPFVVLGYICSAVSRPLLAFASGWGLGLLARSLDRFGKGLRTAPRDALLVESVSERERGVALGWHRGLDTFGAVIGPLIGLMLIENLSSWNLSWVERVLSRALSGTDRLRIVYLVAFVPALLAVLLMTFAQVRKFSGDGLDSDSSTRLKWRFFDLPRDFKMLLLVWAVFSLVNSTDAFLLLKTHRDGLALADTVLLYCLYNVTYALLSPILGHVSDIWGRRRVLIAGLWIFSGVYLGFGWSHAFWHFAGLFGIYGIYMAATDGVVKAYAVDLVPARMRATAIGWLGAVTGVSALFASFVAGVLWDHFGPNWAFLYAAIGALVASVMLLFLKDHRPTILREEITSPSADVD